MALSFVTHIATGTSGDFAIPFDYFDAEHIEARVNNIIVGFTLLNPALLRISPTPVPGTLVSIRRVTPPDLIVPPRDLPTLIRRLSEESRDLVYSFDAIYGEVFYDVAFTIQDGVASTDVVGVVNPNLNLSLSTDSSIVSASPVSGGNVVFNIDAVPLSGPAVPIATATVTPGSPRGVIEVLEASALDAGTVIRVRQAASSVAFDFITLLLRFKRN